MRAARRWFDSGHTPQGERAVCHILSRARASEEWSGAALCGFTVEWWTVGLEDSRTRGWTTCASTSGTWAVGGWRLAEVGQRAGKK